MAESFVYMPESVRLAREAAQDRGVDVPSNGACAALAFLARVIDAKTVVQVGVDTGVSGLALFNGMSDAGVLTVIDLDFEMLGEARRAFTEAGIASHRYRLIAGVARNVMQKLSDGAYDLVVVGGDKLQYVEYVAQAARLLRPGGMLVLADALWRNMVADPRCDDDEAFIIREALQVVQTDEAFTSLIVPLGEGLLVAVKA